MLPQCRSRDDASNKQLRQAAALLKQAAGISLTPALELPSSNATAALDGGDGTHGEAAAADGKEEDVLAKAYPGLDIAESAHVGALRELAVCYELGERQVRTAAVFPCMHACMHACMHVQAQHVQRGGCN